MRVCVCVYHDFVRIALFSVIKGQVSSIVEDQLHSLWCPCCPQHPETQSAGQLARCHTDLNIHTHAIFKPFKCFNVIRKKERI